MIQRNALVAPFPTKTPFNAPKNKGQEEAGSGISRPHIKFQQDLAAAVNNSAQVTDIPASSSATAQPGEIAFDANFLYVAVGVNIWKRVALSSW
jgi:hypothetical protein